MNYLWIQIYVVTLWSRITWKTFLNLQRTSLWLRCCVLLNGEQSGARARRLTFYTSARRGPGCPQHPMVQDTCHPPPGILPPPCDGKTVLRLLAPSNGWRALSGAGTGSRDTRRLELAREVRTETTAGRERDSRGQGGSPWHLEKVSQCLIQWWASFHQHQTQRVWTKMMITLLAAVMVNHPHNGLTRKPIGWWWG